MTIQCLSSVTSILLYAFLFNIGKLHSAKSLLIPYEPEMQNKPASFAYSSLAFQIAVFQH